MARKSQHSDIPTQDIMVAIAELESDPSFQGKSHPIISAMQNKIAELTEERDLLLLEVESIRKKNRKLEEANKEVANRLNSAIRSIESAITVK